MEVARTWVVWVDFSLFLLLNQGKHYASFILRLFVVWFTQISTSQTCRIPSLFLFDSQTKPAMKGILTMCVFWALIAVGYATIGGDVSDYTDYDTFACFKEHGWSFVIVRSYKSYGAIDTNAPKTLAAAKAAGITYRDVYHFPCMGKISAAQQIADNHRQVAGQYGMMWIDVETNPSSGCGFSGNPEENCNFIRGLLQAGSSLGIKMGVYASKWMWNSIAGSGCTAGSRYPLWYPHYDGSRSFSDWSAFGGWTKPSIKQYAETVPYCDTSADADWYA